MWNSCISDWESLSLTCRTKCNRYLLPSKWWILDILFTITARISSISFARVPTRRLTVTSFPREFQAYSFFMRPLDICHLVLVFLFLQFVFSKLKSCIKFAHTARLLWPAIWYSITQLLHLYLHRSNSTAHLKYHCYSVGLPAWILQDISGATSKKQHCRYQCNNCVTEYGIAGHSITLLKYRKPYCEVALYFMEVTHQSSYDSLIANNNCQPCWSHVIFMKL